MSMDYKAMYEEKCQECNQLDEQFQVFQEQSNAVIIGLENEVKELKKKNQMLNRDLAELRQKRKANISALEKELQFIKREKNDFQNKFYDFQKKVVDLENLNDALASENRASQCMLNEYQERVQKTMLELAQLRDELDDCKTTNLEQMARLRSQLKETEEQLFVVHLKHQKQQDESEHRKSARSSMSQHNNRPLGPRNSKTGEEKGSSNKNSGHANEMPVTITGTNGDFKRKESAAMFYKSIQNMTNQMSNVETLMARLKSERLKLVIT